MSCRDIDRGMNEVVRMTISLFDKGEISTESAVKIIATCGIAVNWCDGGDGAIEYIKKCRCGKCLRLLPKGEKLYSIWHLPCGFVEKIGIDTRKLKLASPGLCEGCFDKSLQPFCNDDYNLKNLKESIEAERSIGDYTSEGAPPEHNNSCKWVRGTDWFD